MTQIAFTDPTQVCLVADFYHGNPVDLEKLSKSNWNGIKCPGVIMKCTQGTSYVDSAYKARATQAAGLGIQVAAYHFGTAVDAQARAEKALAEARDKKLDPAEIEQLEAVARFAIIQQLMKKK